MADQFAEEYKASFGHGYISGNYKSGGFWIAMKPELQMKMFGKIVSPIPEPELTLWERIKGWING